MTLENLASIGRLKPHSADRVEIQRLLAAAEVSLKDAQRKEVSASSRFDMAYKSLTQSALTALLANGYRPSTSEPGHHQTILQTLPKTIGLMPERLKLLDVFRRARGGILQRLEGDNKWRKRSNNAPARKWNDCSKRQAGSCRITSGPDPRGSRRDHPHVLAQPWLWRGGFPVLRQCQGGPRHRSQERWRRTG